MNLQVKPATHLAVLCADRGEFDRQRKSLEKEKKITQYNIGN